MNAMDRKWQYKVVRLKSIFKSQKNLQSELEDQLNRLGMERWELVSVRGAEFALELFFKRPY